MYVCMNIYIKNIHSCSCHVERDHTYDGGVYVMCVCVYMYLLLKLVSMYKMLRSIVVYMYIFFKIKNCYCYFFLFFWCHVPLLVFWLIFILKILNLILMEFPTDFACLLLYILYIVLFFLSKALHWPQH